ncbi:hemolysin family protein [Scopulibacillus daqui]|uniref:hemolysin family protein n=1 Tax=Scopulibacillus daqui TaxID=1469162 RepID=UPI0036429241
MDIVGIFTVIILIILSAFFVAAEFSIVKVRSTKLDQLAASGSKRAKAAKQIVNQLDEFLSAAQLGITIISLVLGWVGEPVISHLLKPAIEFFNLGETASRSVSAIISFIIITFLSVVLGELAPKSIAIQKAEKITLMLAIPLIWFNRIAFPFIWLLNSAARIVTRLFGFKPASEQENVHSEEELRLILSESFKGGEINKVELQYMNRIFDFDEKMTKEIMVPRTEIACLYIDDTMEDNIQVLKNEKYTRFPVAEGDKDRIIGMINIKDIFEDFLNQEVHSLDKYIRPIVSVLETTPVRELLVKMQKENIHMAVVVDEYGGTAGLITAEDIIEEIVGDIRDEYDIDEEPEIQEVNDDTVILDGKVLISEVNRLLNINIEEDDLDTIGGWILSEKLEAEEGTTVNYAGYQFKVIESDLHSIKRIEVKKIQEHEHQRG